MVKDKRNTVVNHNYSLRTYSENGYSSFKEFYPYYLGEHCNVINRRLHLTGTTLAVILASIALLTGQFYWLIFALTQGYAFAWTGHFFFEKNKPATFKHPFYSVRTNFDIEGVRLNFNFVSFGIVYGRFPTLVRSNDCQKIVLKSTLPSIVI